MTIKKIALTGQLGLIKDAQPHELPDNAWSDAANVRFRNGAMERMKGDQRIFDVPAVTPYWLQPYYQGGKIYWIHAGLSAIYADDGTARTNISPASAPTGAIDDRWTGGAIGGVLVMNNGKDAPLYWGGTGVLAALPGWPASTTAKSLRPFKSFLVALGVTKSGTAYQHMVKWSVPAVPGAVPASWDHTDPALLAGEIDLAEDPSILVDQMPLGDANIIYKENSMYAMRATGGLDVFSFQRLPGDVGALSRGCIANTPMGHVVLTHGDVVIHSGQGPQSIANGVVRRYGQSSSSGSMSMTGQNPYLKQMGDVMVGQMTDNFNRSVVPAIGSAALASGGYGGSRQGVMEANANNDLQRQIAGGLANLYGNGFNTALNYDLGLRGNDLGFANLDAQINQNNFNNRLNGANFGLGLWNQGMANNQTGINAGTNIQNTPMNYWSQFGNQYNSIGQGFGTTTGSASQQGNPLMGALGGAQLGSQIGNWWGGSPNAAGGANAQGWGTGSGYGNQDLGAFL